MNGNVFLAYIEQVLLPTRQFIQDNHKTGPIKRQEPHPVVTAIAKGKDRRRKKVKLHHLLEQTSATGLSRGSSGVPTSAPYHPISQGRGLP
jgi:hypothetical protein